MLNWKRCAALFVGLVCYLSAATSSAHLLDGIPFARIGSLGDVVEARFPRGSVQSSSHNGGLSQTNITFQDAFINVIKAAGGDLKEASGHALFGAPADPSARDMNGYPTTTTNGWIVQVLLTSALDQPGNWIQTWTGLGTIQNLTTAVAYTISSATNDAGGAVLTLNLASPVSPNTQTTNQLKLGQCVQLASASGGTWNTVSGNFYKILDAAVGGDATKVKIDLNSSGLGSLSAGQAKNALRNTTTASAACVGRYVFTPPSNGEFPIDQQPGVVSMSAAPDYIRDVAVYHQDEEAVFLAGEVWKPKFVERLRDAKVGAIRSLDVQINNSEKTLNWASRKSASYATYGSPSWLPSSVSPSGLATSHSGCDYTLAWPGYSLANDAIVHVFFDASCAGAARLQVGSTGFKNILSMQSTALDGDTLVKGGTTDSFATLIYKSKLNAWIKIGGDNTGSSGYRTYLPPELLLDLCVRVGAHPYYLTPAYDDTADWTTENATYFKNNAPTWMRYFQETPNEPFNNAAAFDNNGYALAFELYENGGWDQSTGAPSGVTYSASSVTSGVSTTVTLNTAFTGRVGAWLSIGGTWSGLTGISAGQYAHVTAINVGGNPNRITIDKSTSGTWTSGGTLVASPGEMYEWLGTTAAKMAKAVSDVFNGDTSRYHTILGIQTAQAQSGGSMSNMDAAAESSQFVLQGGFAAKTYLTAGAPANYIKSSERDTSAECCAGGSRVANWAPRQFSGYITGTTLNVTSGTPPNVGDEVSAVYVRRGTLVTGGSNPTFTVDLSQIYASSGSPQAMFAGSPATRRSEEDGYVNAALTGSDQENLSTAVTYWLNAANWLDSKGIKTMLGYEGGPTNILTNYASISNTAIDNFRAATVDAVAWSSVIQASYASWKFGQYPAVSSQYPVGFTAVFPSQYLFNGEKPRSRAWVMLPGVFWPNNALYDGIKAFNSNWLLKRDIHPASNDNDPMWLEKAA